MRPTSPAAAKNQLCSPSVGSTQPKNTGTAWAASSQILATVIGSRVRSLACRVVRLGPLAGPAVMMLLFSYVVYYLFTLLSPCYRTGDPVNGERNSSNIDAVRSNLRLPNWRLVGPLDPPELSFSGGFRVVIQWCVQFLNLFLVTTAYTVTTCIGMMVVVGPDCSHRRKMTPNPYMIAFGIAQIFLSQIPDFNQQWWLSVVAAVKSFTIETVDEIQNMLQSFQHDGYVALAYSHSQTLTEIRDRITPPLRNFNKPLLITVATATLFYVSFAIFSYALFGDTGNLFTGFGFSNANWLEVIANLNVVLHLLGAYQAYCRPLFVFVEKAVKEIEVAIPRFKPFDLNLFRLVFTTVFVIVVTAISMALPVLDDTVALLCSSGLWAITTYFPVVMYIVQMLLPLEF